VSALLSSSPPADAAPNCGRRCVFCLENIRPGASVCPHCGSNLARLQDFVDRQTALEKRVAALEQEIAAQRIADEQTTVSEAALSTPPSPAASAVPADIKWHMIDNIFLGLTALLAAHWLATTLPAQSRAFFRLVALVLALPFGFRFERNSRSGAAGQVLAALALGSMGTLAIGLLDTALADRTPPLSPQDIVACVAAMGRERGGRADRCVLSRRNRIAHAYGAGADQEHGRGGQGAV
jgi:hypothetical protein